MQRPSIHWLGQASFRIASKDEVIYIDPIRAQVNSPKAKIILITHFHGDHFSEKTIRALSTAETRVFTPNGFGSYELIKPGDVIEINSSLKIDVLPAYNVHKSFHPKQNNWVGYIVDIGGARIYHAGDTDFIPEMKEVKADIALLPIGGTSTMDYREAVEAAKVIRPKTAIPIHYGSSMGTAREAQEFVKMCQNFGINGEILKVEL